MELALFDLDNTLLGGDSDYLWGRFLIEEGLVDERSYERENERFYMEYREGRLDIDEFLRFQLRPLADYRTAELQEMRARYLEEKIRPIVLPAARDLIEEHRSAGRYLLIITATNSFLTRPIADMLGVETLLATEPEMVDGRYTGGVAGTPCFRDGKVVRLHEWLARHGMNLEHSWFYSDSHNDLPLLELVAHPVAVDPDETLAQHAETKGWPIISLRA